MIEYKAQNIVESAIKLGAYLRNDCNTVGTDGRRIIVYVESSENLTNPVIPNYYDGFAVYVKVASLPTVKITDNPRTLWF